MHLFIFACIEKSKTKLKSIIMGRLLRTGLKTILVVMILGLSVNVSGQATMNDVKASFNQAVQMEKINPEAAIGSYEKVIELAAEVGGAEADQIKGQAVTRIPKMNYEAAKKLAGKKDYEGAVEKLDAAIDGFKAIDDKRQVARSLSTILSIRNVQGNTAFSEKNYEAALGFFDDAIARKPNYTKAYLGKLLVYDKMGDIAKMEETAKKGLEVASAKDNSITGNIKKKMRGYYFNAAQQNMAGQDYSTAESNLKNSILYGNGNMIVHYQIGLAQKGQKKWSDAVQSFNEALVLETGADEDKAKIYFELGTAYQALGDNSKSCESFKKALFGEFAEAARYQIEKVLMCDN